MELMVLTDKMEQQAQQVQMELMELTDKTVQQAQQEVTE